jgi:hypothetical protein
MAITSCQLVDPARMASNSRVRMQPPGTNPPRRPLRASTAILCGAVRPEAGDSGGEVA